ncbi:MAG: beta-galactosidase [Candidatus Aenigmatarchaeota archaeon]|nr:MAG: beta-galactosidase [Candidatus Aenigmarchaeota archaeon]
MKKFFIIFLAFFLIPISVSADTELLRCYFENSVVCRGEEPDQISTLSDLTLERGEIGNGVLINDFDVLAYPTLGNFNKDNGTIEFWMIPKWNGDDGKNHVFFDNRFNSSSYGFQVYKHGNTNNLLLIVHTQNPDGIDYKIQLQKDVSDWVAGETHFIKATFETDGKLNFYIDSEDVGEKIYNPPPFLNDKILLSSFVDENGDPSTYGRTDSVIDELRILDHVEDLKPDYSLELGVYSFFNKNRFKWKLRPELAAMEELGYDFIDAASFTVTWRDLQPSEYMYNWTLIDKVISKAASEGKKINICPFTSRLSYIPEWLPQKNGFQFFETVTVSGNEDTVVAIPWNSVYKYHLYNFIEKLAERYKENETINYINIAGGGTTTGSETTYTFPVTNPDFSIKFQEFKNLGYSEDVDRVVWKDLIDKFAKEFPNKYLTLNAHFSYPDNSTKFSDWNADLAFELMDYSVKKYGNKVIFINTFGNANHWWDNMTERILNDQINTESEKLVNKQRELSDKTNIARQTARYSEAGDYSDTEWISKVGEKIGSLGKAIHNAYRLNMTIVEIYVHDIMTPWAPGDTSTVGNCFDELSWAHKCFKYKQIEACDKLDEYVQIV